MKIKLFFLNKLFAMRSRLRDFGITYKFKYHHSRAGRNDEVRIVGPQEDGTEMYKNPSTVPSKNPISSLFFCSTLLLFLSSCASSPARINYYDFGSPTSSTDNKLSCTLPPIYLSDITVPSTLESEAMHYRLLYADDLQARVYASSRWGMKPAELLAQRIKSQLISKGVTFIDSGIKIQDAHQTPLQLRLQLDDFGQYFSDPNRSYAQLKVNATLLQGRTLIAQTTLEQQANADTPDAIAGVRALRVASDEMITKLGNWLCGVR